MKKSAVITLTKKIVLEKKVPRSRFLKWKKNNRVGEKRANSYLESNIDELCALILKEDEPKVA